MAQIEKSFSPEEYMIRHSVEETCDGMRLDNFMMQFFASLSREHVKKKIKKGEILISNRTSPHKSSTKVYIGDMVTMRTRRQHLEDEYWKGKKIEFNENPNLIETQKDFVILSKPPFMSPHPTGRHLFYCATVFMENLLNEKVYGIHRIDRETSGLLVMARNLGAASRITDRFEKKEVRKAYFLIGKKNPLLSLDKFPFTASERLGQDINNSGRLQTLCYPQESSDGKQASTKFQKIFENDKYIVALAFPETGRQHQIRAHAAHHGFPLLGDKIYNGDPGIFGRIKDQIATEDDYAILQIPRHALHAIGINFGEGLFTDEIPKDLKDWMSEQNFPELDEEIKNQLSTSLK